MAGEPTNARKVAVRIGKSLEIRDMVPPKARVRTRAEGRTCGKCSECCRLLGVPDIKKKPDVLCPHQNVKKGGCAIYGDRPPLCVDYECIWLQGGFQGRDKPSRLHVVFDALVRQDPDVQAVCARKTRPGPLTKRARVLIDRLAQQMVVVLIESATEARRVMGPGNLVDEFISRAEERMKDGEAEVGEAISKEDGV